MIFSVESIEAGAFDFDDGEFCADEMARGFGEAVDVAGLSETRAVERDEMSPVDGAV